MSRDCTRKIRLIGVLGRESVELSISIRHGEVRERMAEATEEICALLENNEKIAAAEAASIAAREARKSITQSRRAAAS